MQGNHRSKIITATFILEDARHDTYFFEVPGEISDADRIKDTIVEKYRSGEGMLNGLVDGQRIIVHWRPERIHSEAESLHREATEFAKTKKYPEAIEKWEKAIALNASDVEFLYRLALVHFELKNYPTSLDYLEKAVKICPIHHKAYLLMGINWIKLRKFEEAESCILESFRLNRSNALTSLNLGVIYSVQKRFNDAIRLFNASIQISPKEARAYFGLARIYNMLNDVETSSNYFKKVIELAPDTQMAAYAKRSIIVPEETVKGKPPVKREESFAKGMGYYLGGDYQKAAAEYKSYLNSHPSDDYGWYLLGESQLRTGEVEASADCFKRAVKLNSRRIFYYKSLGVALHFLGKAQETVDVLKKAIEIGQKDALCYALLGINMNRLRKMDDSIQNLRMSLEKYPNNPLAQYHLSMALVQTQDQEHAVELLNEILAYPYDVPMKSQAKSLLKNIDASLDV